ncbi:hypothetical protein M407DRAFT_216853 [Tulasnella calospora MUT 4182]|uniref:Uncharacterized protein n=1 Tax=Tulasnella calospora MUT 4182 TaxID=1051891 RepID=A0A0C3Q1P5_9AGAM|nr:hypothetical protein M407DRAFT_216853 [Tulasnella calospora MUT 4182]
MYEQFASLLPVQEDTVSDLTPLLENPKLMWLTVSAIQEFITAQRKHDELVVECVNKLNEVRAVESSQKPHSEILSFSSSSLEAVESSPHPQHETLSFPPLSLEAVESPIPPASRNIPATPRPPLPRRVSSISNRDVAFKHSRANLKRPYVKIDETEGRRNRAAP